MKTFGQYLQSGDWKGEKHVPVIHAPEKVKAGESFELKISVGEEIPHPNSLEHYIAWGKIFFFQEGGKFPVELADFKFASHGEGGNFTEPVGLTKVKLDKSGTIHAIIYCNIHGVWENNQEIIVE